MFYLKVHDSGGREIVALCDKELIGKIFRENDLKLEVNERFYKGDLINAEEARQLLTNFSNINIVGENSIKICRELEIVNDDSIMIVEGISYAMVLSIWKI